MSDLAIEELLGLWLAELREAKDRLRPLFSQAGTAGSAALFLGVQTLGLLDRDLMQRATAARAGLVRDIDEWTSPL